MQKVTQEELNRIVPELIETYGALSDASFVEKVEKEYHLGCTLEDIRIHFDPTLGEEVEDLELMYEHV